MIYLNKILDFIKRPVIKLSLTITSIAILGLLFYNIGINFGKTLHYLV